MTVNVNLTTEVTSTAAYETPLRLGATAATDLNASGTGGVTTWENTATNSGIYGGRRTFTSIDLSVYTYIGWQLASRRFNFPGGGVTDFSVGGIIVLFEDSSGNYAGWRVYGRGITGYDPQDRQSYFVSYSSDCDFLVKREATPAYSSGTIDWADIVAFEILADVTVNNGSLGMNRVRGFGQANVTGTGDTFADFASAYNSAGIPTHFFDAVPLFSGASQLQYSVRHGFDIGDGTTSTTFTDSDFFLGLTNPQSFQADGFVTTGYLLNQPDNRLIRVRANATANLSDFSISSAGQFEVINQGTSNFTRGSIIRANSVDASGSATYTSCILDECQEFIIDATTVVTGGIYRNQPTGGSGLTVSGAAGDYSAIDVFFDNNNDKDISLGAGGAGTYNFSGVSVTSGYTLKIRNNSATNAVTIILPAGIATSTSTAGGSITVQSPATTYTLQLPNIINGSRFQIYNVTTDTELTNSTTSGGTGINQTYTAGTDYTAGDTGRYRITYQSGTTAKESIDGTFTFPSATAINSLPEAQVDQAIYNAFGVDGSTVTEFSWDSGNIQVDINDADNTTTVQRFGAWYYYFITTATGIDEAYGALFWENLNSLKINASVVDMTLDNTKASPLLLTGGRLYRDDEATIIAAASNSIQVDYSPVYAIETGVSGLTAPESALLTAAGNASMTIETGYTLAESVRLMSSVLAGKVSGAGTGTEVFRDVNDTKDRVTSTVDSAGNRTTVVLDGS